MLKRIKPLLSAAELKNILPRTVEAERVRSAGVRDIKSVLDGTDARKIVIVGPCSADDPTAVVKYAQKLSRVAHEIESKIVTVMRVYTAKPRSRGDEYKGLLHSPHGRSGENDLEAGLFAMRGLHLRVMTESGLPTADEMVYPDLYEYTDDLLSYITVGARTAEDPMHRFVASGAEAPVGIKNPINGNLLELADSIYTAGRPSEFIFDRAVVHTDGNAYAHGILRGAMDEHGNNIPNCGYEKTMLLLHALQSRGVSCGVIIDTGHGNSGKNPDNVFGIATDVFGRFTGGEYNAFVKGLMIESYLVGGNSAAPDACGGISVTDPCLGFEDTKRLLLTLADML